MRAFIKISRPTLQATFGGAIKIHPFGGRIKRATDSCTIIIDFIKEGQVERQFSTKVIGRAISMNYTGNVKCERTFELTCKTLFVVKN